MCHLLLNVANALKALWTQLLAVQLAQLIVRVLIQLQYNAMDAQQVNILMLQKSFVSNKLITVLLLLFLAVFNVTNNIL